MDLSNDSTEVPLTKQGDPVLDEHKKIRFSRDTQYKNFTLKQAQELLTAQGFVEDPDRTQQFQTATVYHWKNPHTTQRANLSHKSFDKRQRPLDEAKIAYHQVVQNKRRTPDQKYRDNYVLYD